MVTTVAMVTTITMVTSCCYYVTTILVLDTQFVLLAPPSNSEVKDGWVSWNSCCYGNGYYIRIE